MSYHRSCFVVGAFGHAALPQELFDAIIDLVASDHRTLAACAAVSRAWATTAALHRHHSIHISSGPGFKAIAEELLTSTPSVRNNVRVLHIRSSLCPGLSSAMTSTPWTAVAIQLCTMAKYVDALHINSAWTPTRYHLPLSSSATPDCQPILANLTALTLSRISVQDHAALFSVLNPATSLQYLTLDDVALRQQVFGEPLTPWQPPLALRSLHFARTHVHREQSPFLRVFNDIFFVHLDVVKLLRSVSLDILYQEDLVWVKLLLSRGDALQELSLHFFEHTPLIPSYGKGETDTWAKWDILPIIEARRRLDHFSCRATGPIATARMFNVLGMVSGHSAKRVSLTLRNYVDDAHAPVCVYQSVAGPDVSALPLLAAAERIVLAFSSASVLGSINAKEALLERLENAIHRDVLDVFPASADWRGESALVWHHDIHREARLTAEQPASVRTVDENTERLIVESIPGKSSLLRRRGKGSEDTVPTSKAALPASNAALAHQLSMTSASRPLRPWNGE